MIKNLIYIISLSHLSVQVAENQIQIKKIIEDSIEEMTPDILGEAEEFEFERVRLSDSGRLADIRQVHS